MQAYQKVETKDSTPETTVKVIKTDKITSYLEQVELLLKDHDTVSIVGVKGGMETVLEVAE
jgi:hypothetical protein